MQELENIKPKRNNVLHYFFIFLFLLIVLLNPFFIYFLIKQSFNNKLAYLTLDTDIQVVRDRIEIINNKIDTSKNIPDSNMQKYHLMTKGPDESSVDQVTEDFYLVVLDQNDKDIHIFKNQEAVADVYGFSEDFKYFYKCRLDSGFEVYSVPEFEMVLREPNDERLVSCGGFNPSKNTYSFFTNTDIDSKYKERIYNFKSKELK